MFVSIKVSFRVAFKELALFRLFRNSSIFIYRTGVRQLGIYLYTCPPIDQKNQQKGVNDFT